MQRIIEDMHQKESEDIFLEGFPEGFREGYLEGFREGYLEGFREGFREGCQKRDRELVPRMLSLGESPERIAILLDRPLDYIKKLQAESLA